jgi:hypothetical protein
MPEMAPDRALMDTPGGSEPLATLKVGLGYPLDVAVPLMESPIVTLF